MKVNRAFFLPQKIWMFEEIASCWVFACQQDLEDGSHIPHVTLKIELC